MGEIIYVHDAGGCGVEVDWGGVTFLFLLRNGLANAPNCCLYLLIKLYNTILSTARFTSGKLTFLFSFQLGGGRVGRIRIVITVCNSVKLNEEIILGLVKQYHNITITINIARRPLLPSLS